MEDGKSESECMRLCVCVCNLLYIQEWGHSRCACYCYQFACCAWFILWGDRGEGWGALSNEAPPPHPRKRTRIVCSWVPEWAAGGTSPFIFMFISFHAVPFRVSGSAGQDPYPNVLISFCFAGMPFLLSGVPLESKSSFIFHACFSRPPLGSVKPLQPHVIWSCLEFLEVFVFLSQVFVTRVVATTEGTSTQQGSLFARFHAKLTLEPYLGCVWPSLSEGGLSVAVVAHGWFLSVCVCVCTCMCVCLCIKTQKFVPM